MPHNVLYDTFLGCRGKYEMQRCGSAFYRRTRDSSWRVATGVPSFLRLRSQTQPKLSNWDGQGLFVRTEYVSHLAIAQRSRRSPLPTTSRLAPMSAKTAIHRVAWPVVASAKNTILIPIAKQMFWERTLAVFRLRLM